MSWKLVLSLSAVVFAALLEAQDVAPSSCPTTRPSPTSRPRERGDDSEETESFFFITDKDIYAGRFHVTMRCPAHAYRSPRWALEHLRRIHLDDPGREIRVWVCRVNQMQTLRMFAQAPDVIGVNPFIALNKDSPKREAVIWPGLDRRLLNSIRGIRNAAPNTRLFACISVDGQSPLFPKRSPSLQELRWMACAVIGGSFQGISWRPDRGTSAARKEIVAIEEAVRPFAKDLATARPVNLVSAPKDQPVTALVHGKRLFVVLLSPDYLNYRDGRPVTHPLDLIERTGEIKIRTSRRFRVTSAATISGLPLVVREEADASCVSYRLADSADILVINVDRPPGEATSRPSRPKPKGAKR